LEEVPVQNLLQAVRSRNIILFVGGGVSANLGLPEWRGLIRHLASDLGLDPDRYTAFPDYLALAEYYLEEKGSLEPLLSWMDRTWHSPEKEVGASPVHRLIVELAPPIIYTTNYDRWLEKAFEHHGKSYTRIAGVADFTGIRDDVTQIVKFHGDFQYAGSVVLTESSYFERLAFESPLDIKLRSDMLCRTILFIGYRLSDINIRYLFYKLQRLWDSALFSEKRPPSYIFLSRPDPVQEAVLRRRGIVTIASRGDNPGEGLRLFLEDLVRNRTA
jgi:NAD-dependent SIR2 family protein deacetylase